MNLIDIFRSKRIAADYSVPTKSYQDLRVIIPEGLTSGMEEGYLDFDINPLQLAEIQRTGLFLMEHMAAALVSYNNLQILNRKYEQECADHRATKKEHLGLEGAFDELVHERNTFRQERDDLATELQHAQDQLAALRGASEYDKTYIESLETRLQNLSATRNERD